MAAAARPLWADDAPIRIGVSSCLLGREVRFDGGHKRDRFLTDALAPWVTFVPVCPEVEAGLGTPREAIHLEREGGRVRLRGVGSGDDHTRELDQFAHRRTRELERDDLCGYVLKKDSPSCGLHRVKVYPEDGPPKRDGRGRFASALVDAFPSLPVEEEGRLNDPVLRENWIERVFAYRRLLSFLQRRFSMGGLVRFHTAHKLQVMAHSPKAYRELGRFVAEAAKIEPSEVKARYAEGLMAALAVKATRGRHANVLQHAGGYLRPHLDDASRSELAELIEAHRVGELPLVVPVTLLRHHVRRIGVDYLADQVYLDPHPRELMLRNHV